MSPARVRTSAVRFWWFVIVLAIAVIAVALVADPLRLPEIQAQPVAVEPGPPTTLTQLRAI